jgi:MarR family transcriptional regulator, 2-MHQ and catechol-resistance regulon repressor
VSEVGGVRRSGASRGAAAVADRVPEVAFDEASTCGALAAIVNDERIVLMGLMIETHAKLTRSLGEELEQALGLPFTWFIVLVHLGRSEQGRLTMSQLGTEIALTSGGITRLVDRMTEARLVERQVCPSDRRATYVALTPEGEEMLARATEEHLRGLDRHLLEPLTADERAALELALRKLRGPGPI